MVKSSRLLPLLNVLTGFAHKTIPFMAPIVDPPPLPRPQKKKKVRKSGLKGKNKINLKYKVEEKDK